MTPHDFVAKWQPTTLSERSAAQQHFLDLCELLGQPKPADVDSDGSWQGGAGVTLLATHVAADRDTKRETSPSITIGWRFALARSLRHP